jgi:alpha-tubulin suppressor-like RCC1 family protein
MKRTTHMLICYGEGSLIENVQQALSTNNVDPFIVKNRGKWNRTAESDFIQRVKKPVPIDPLTKYQQIITDSKQIHIQESPLVIESFTPSSSIVKISCTYKHTLLLLENGELYSVGEGVYGKLGHGETSSEMTPILIMYHVKDISTGIHHSAAISDNKLYTWGCAEYGQTGQSTVESSYSPKPVQYFIDNNIVPIQVACGEKHTIVLANNGLVYGFGMASYGQIGYLSHLKEDPTIDIYDSQLMNQWTPKIMKCYSRISENSQEFKRLRVRRDFLHIQHISCGQNFTVLLNDKGQLYFCGENITGVGCQGDTKTRQYKVKQCLFENPDTVSQDTIQVELTIGNDRTMNTDIILKQESVPIYPAVDSNSVSFVQVSSGWAHIVALTSNGDLYGGGLNVGSYCCLLYMCLFLYRQIHNWVFQVDQREPN